MKFLNRMKLILLTIYGRPRCITEFGQFCRSQRRNFANWPVEFGKIFCGKMWALVIALVVVIA